MNALSNKRLSWNTAPMKMQLNQEIINYMVAYVTEATGIVEPGTLVLEGKSTVHLLEKEKEFKYGKGKEYIAFTDGGKNQFGKDVKYVKFFYLYENNSKMKPNDKTYTFGLEKARTFWSDKVKDGYTNVKFPDQQDVSPVETTT